jgi:protein tyrosine phosphatase (PTP) superfamily phosphohydrolase (DUF442 family)
MSAADTILNFVAWDERLASSGQPKPEEFALLAAQGFETSVNLATEASTGHLPDEPGLCARAGIEFTWIPVDWKAPRLEDYLAFQQWLDANRSRKALVHCAMNWRASLFCALYRMIRQGLSPEKAREDVLGVWEPDEVWTALSREVLAVHGLPPVPFR